VSFSVKFWLKSLTNWVNAYFLVYTASECEFNP